MPILSWSPASLFSGSEEEAEQAKQALLKEVGKVTDIVSSLGFSWWQGGPPHTQSLKDLHWVSAHTLSNILIWFLPPHFKLKQACIHLQESHWGAVIFPFLWNLQVIETLLFSTFVSWKAFYPLVRDDSNCTYTFITGEASQTAPSITTTSTLQRNAVVLLM